MAKFRKVFTAFWDDTYIEKLSPEDRYFYLFLLTNPLCAECGIYSISIKKMCHYSGYNQESVAQLIKRFIESGKILYDNDTAEICIVKKIKYLENTGKPFIDLIKSELENVKNIEFIDIISQNTEKQIIKQLLHETYTARKRYVENKLTYSGREKNRIEGEKEEEGEREKEATLPINNLNRQPIIPTKKDVWEVFCQLGGSKEQAKAFFEKYESVGWYINSSPITNFKPLANKFMDTWGRNDAAKNKTVDSTKVKIIR